MSGASCPCGKGLYKDCCEPLHSGKTRAVHAEQLMRSRYSAFALQQIGYIVKTTASGQQPYLEVPAIQQWSETNRWLGLEVINFKEKLTKHHAEVEFRAHYHDGEQPQLHHEISYFVQQAGQWFFLDPTVDMPVTMKQPCICGSGKKFKQCCAPFLVTLT
ncbi:hypothetical protein J577_2326 [Acinetobacter sp. 263903-1]|jgi:SEC-C motif-containing protein|uniref:YchJ family protein n=1 Tax=Acinetobacter TaxID=469 RepID=UPI0004A0418A|nr:MULTISPECIES: YchJ family protein [Acinetobacter]KCX36516.1 hypothetical protein J577_2326 [Acinetobacter sp. 263903-1]